MKSLLVLSILLMGSISYSGLSQFQKIEKKAKQGDSLAQYDLGVMYFEGKDVPKDEKKAVYWITKSANQGDVFSQLALVQHYSIGRSDVKAYKWALVISKTQVHKKDRPLKDLAIISLGRLEEKMTPVQLTESKTLASSTIKKLLTLKKTHRKDKE